VTNHVEQEVVSLRNRLQRCESSARVAIERLRTVEHLLFAQQGTLPIGTVAELIGHLQQTRHLLTCGEVGHGE
jgi:hypothetical protein